MTMRFKSVLVAGGVLALAFSLWAQKDKDKAPSGPKPKNNKEVAALNAINAAPTVDDKLKAIDNVLTNFKDTEFKPMLLEMALQLEAQKGDYAQVVTYGQEILDKDPKNAVALVTLAGETARRTREFDLDKDEKLAKADKWAKDGIEAAKTAPKPAGTNMTDDQWEHQRKDLQSQGYEALGMSATVSKKYDDAITNFKLALDLSPTAGTWLRLGQAYEDASKWDEASDAYDKAGAMPNASAQIKTIATSKKAEVAKLKAGGGAKPPASAAPGGPQPVPIQH